jgi:glycosyltransferase involved in cell wall biosynthesis
MKRIILVTEILSPPYDEGIKKTVRNLYLELQRNFDLTVICRFGFNDEKVKIVSTNSLFLSKQVYSIIQKTKPDAIIYLPFASSTFASYLRLKVLSLFTRKSKSIFFALQPKPIRNWHSVIVNHFLKPETAITPSPELYNYWKGIKVNSELVPLYTNLERFSPLVSCQDKEKLRLKYNVPLNKFIITHMGHLNNGRNLQTLIPLQTDDSQVVIVSSTSTPTDAIGSDKIKEELIAKGIIILEQYIEDIKEVYQLSDLYIFPVEAKNSSIGMPLSILEARACGIRVLTTDFGSVREFLGEDFGNISYSESSLFSKQLFEIKKSNTQSQHSNVFQLNKKFLDVLHMSIDCSVIFFILSFFEVF